MAEIAFFFDYVIHVKKMEQHNLIGMCVCVLAAVQCFVQVFHSMNDLQVALHDRENYGSFCLEALI